MTKRTTFSIEQIKRAFAIAIESSEKESEELSSVAKEIGELWGTMVFDQHEVIDSVLVPDHLHQLIESSGNHAK
jgi:hypothetical protein